MKRSSKHAFVTALAISASLLSHSSHAERIYKWVDQDGSIHYGDKRPVDATSEEMTVRAQKGTPDVPKKTEDTQTKSASEKTALNPEAKAELQKYCDQAKANLQTLETRSRIRVPEGETFRFLTPEEITAKKDEIAKAIEKNCSPQ
ncbi:MAG: DUF4124 domain-containing protein [Hahellaceae bacterium]|nr:DUF4124 domain-containing protein [Hahellaceae bacterium]MCP5168735.1 DUF4124 domain-containing protein [Hahellaceae bacterium]